MLIKFLAYKMEMIMLKLKAKTVHHSIHYSGLHIHSTFCFIIPLEY